MKMRSECYEGPGWPGSDGGERNSTVGNKGLKTGGVSTMYEELAKFNPLFI
jgi:hypothetical protein